MFHIEPAHFSNFHQSRRVSPEVLLKQRYKSCTPEALATLAVRQRETSRHFLFDEEMRLCGWRNSKTGEEIISQQSTSYQELAFSGIHVVRRELLDLIPSAEKQSITPIYVDLARTNLLKGFLHNEGHWKDMGKLYF